MNIRKQLPLLAALLLFGCQSEDAYRHRAVERAREYLLEEVRTLTPEQEAYVRFNYPVLLHGPVTGSGAAGLVTSETRQICVAWSIPGEKVDYLVFGYSEPRMQFWRPLRLIRRPRSIRGSRVNALRGRAVAEVITNLQDRLSVTELNNIRFGYPKVALMNFSVTGREKQPQLVLLWPVGKGTKYAAVAGEGDETMKSWRITSTGILSAEEAAKATVKVLSDPARKEEEK